VSSQELEQSPQSLIVQEGEDFTINCSSSKPVYALHWYRQNKSKRLISLLRLISSGTEKSGWLKGTLDKKELLSTLHITATKPGDSATYLCAVEARCCLVSCCLHPNAPAEAPTP
ncbi:unnamed protein product, partial [Gulo gulo]